jgi:hypothetical protein
MLNMPCAIASKICLRRLLLLVLLLPALLVQAAEFEVTRLSTRLKDGVYLVDAHIDYRFSDQALEALQNGVPLTLEMHVQLRRKGAWVWESDILEMRLRYRIRYHALASVYQVIDLQSETQQNFATRQSALAALGEISGLPLIRKAQLDPNEVYILSLRTRLDIEALPLPLRPLAYLTPAWNLSSEWKRWQLQP